MIPAGNVRRVKNNLVNVIDGLRLSLSRQKFVPTAHNSMALVRIITYSHGDKAIAIGDKRSRDFIMRLTMSRVQFASASTGSTRRTRVTIRRLKRYLKIFRTKILILTAWVF